MNPSNPHPGPEGTTIPDLRQIADSLSRESERLKQLADDLRAREEALAEMQSQYPHLKRVVYDMLREQALRESPPIPVDDLEAFAASEGAVPLEDFIGELEGTQEGA